MKKYIKPSIEIEAILTEGFIANSIENNPNEENDSNRAPEFDFAENYGKY